MAWGLPILWYLACRQGHSWTAEVATAQHSTRSIGGDQCPTQRDGRACTWAAKPACTPGRSAAASCPASVETAQAPLCRTLLLLLHAALCSFRGDFHRWCDWLPKVYIKWRRAVQQTPRASRARGGKLGILVGQCSEQRGGRNHLESINRLQGQEGMLGGVVAGWPIRGGAGPSELSACGTGRAFWGHCVGVEACAECQVASLLQIHAVFCIKWQARAGWLNPDSAEQGIIRQSRGSPRAARCGQAQLSHALTPWGTRCSARSSARP